jgi:hypothetical protein
MIVIATAHFQISKVISADMEARTTAEYHDRAVEPQPTHLPEVSYLIEPAHLGCIARRIDDRRGGTSKPRLQRVALLQSCIES